MKSLKQINEPNVLGVMSLSQLDICHKSRHVRLNAAAFFSIFQGRYWIKADMRDQQGNKRRIACLETEVETRG